MKKTVWILSISLLAISPTFAQKDTRAQRILDTMSQYYKSLKSYQTTFTYTSAGAGAKESYTSDLTVKNEKFRLVVGGQEVFNDGRTMYTYSKESNEVNVQDYDASANNEMNPAQIYTIYKRGFNYRFLKEQKQGGRTVEVIELTSNRPKSAIATVQISVDKVDKSIRNWVITNRDGKRTSYTITKFMPNVAVSDSYFVFDKAKYPGVEIVDLR